jgi:hypothetical protein
MVDKRRDDSERIRNEASIQSASLTTTGTAMLLGLLAAAEAHQRQGGTQPTDTGNRHAIQPDDASSMAQPSPAMAHDTATPVIPHATDVEHHGAVTAPAQQQPVIDAGPQIQPAPEIQHASAPIDTGTSTVSSETPAETPPAAGHADSLQDTLSSLSSNLSDQIQHMMSQVLPDPGALASSINSTVDDITSAVLSVPESAAHSLVSAAFDAPASLPAHEVIDTTALGALPLELAMPVGLVGQPYADGHDPHDGAFSAIGIHGF